jgi:hypothetical protein
LGQSETVAPLSMLNQMLKHKPMIAPIVFGIIDKPSSWQVFQEQLVHSALSVG